MTTSAITRPGEWDIVTCEYPPTIGGVSDYTFTLASELAASQPVHVWCPETAGAVPALPNVAVHMLRSFSPGELRSMGAQLDARPGRRQLFVQWVPQGFGYRSLNLGFARWVAARGRKGDLVHLMVHEPFMSWSAAPLHLAASLVHRAMLARAASTVSQVWVSTSTWAELIRRYVPAGTPIEWLPVPAPALPDAAATPSAASRRQLTVGHFGTHSPLVQEMLGPALERLLPQVDAQILLVGRDSDVFRERFLATHPEAAPRIHATGALRADELAAQLRQCDLMLQPYPDGITTRRTSALALMSLGLPVVTNSGHLSEPFWRSCAAVHLVEGTDPAALADAACSLLTDKQAREELGARARVVYDARFAPRHAAAILNAVAGRHRHAA
jgi:glycosyltransferase involved in cell wall biosynthesis